MKSRLVLLLFALSLFMPAISQDCTYYYPQRQGAKLTYQHFDRKDKPTGKSTQEVISFETNSTGASAVIRSTSYDEKDEALSSVDLEIRCEAGIFYLDMENYLNQQSMAAYKDMDAEVDMTELEIPSKLKVGDRLKDGSIKISLSSNGMKVMTLSIQILDRVVEKKETINTQAGNYECLKINQTVIMKAGLTIVSKSSEWFAENVGIIKTETFNKKGSRVGWTELVELTK